MVDNRKYITAGIDQEVFKAPSSSSTVMTNPSKSSVANSISSQPLNNPYTDKPLTSTVSGTQGQNTIKTVNQSTVSTQVKPTEVQPQQPLQQPVVQQKPIQTISEQQWQDTYNKANPAQKATLDEQKRLGKISVTPSLAQPGQQQPTGPIFSTEFQGALDETAKAFGLDSYKQFKDRYGEVIDESLGSVYDLTDPNQQAALKTKLQGIMGAKVGTASDMGMLGGQRDSILTNFTDGQKILDTYQSLTNELKKGLSIQQAAQNVGIPLKQATDFMQGKFDDYGNLTDAAKLEATKRLDIEKQNLEREYITQQEKIDGDMAWVRQQYETQYQRTTEQNQTNEANANILARMTGIGFSTRGIQGLQAIQDQGKQLLDDLTSNYERSSQQINQLKIQLANTYTYNNAKLTQSLNDAIANAKNAYMQNVVGLQEKYGLAGLAGQNAIAEATNGFIKTAQDIYNTNFDQQQQLYQELRAQSTAIRQNELQDQQIKKNNFDQFKEVSGTMNRSQVLEYAKRNGLESIVNDMYAQQEASIANSLNNIKGLEVAQLGAMFSADIAEGLANNKSPDQIVRGLLQSGKIENAIQDMPMTPDQKIQLQQSLVDLQKGQQALQKGNLELQAMQEELKGPTPTVQPVPETKVKQTLDTFLQTTKVGEVFGECGKYVNDYLQGMGLPRIFTDPITDKAKFINSNDPKAGDVVLLDYGVMVEDGKGGKINAGHVAVVTSKNTDGTINVRDANYGGQKKGDIYVGDKKVQERKLTKSEMGKVQGYFDPTLGVEGTKKKLSDKEFTQSNQVITSFKSDPQVKAFEEAYSQGLNLLSSLNDESGPGDVAAIFQFMKTLDPQSVVRESEFETAAKSAGVANYIGNTFERLSKGKKLTEEQRKAFGTLAKQFITNKATIYDTKYKDGIKRLEQQGITSDVFPTSIADQMRQFIGKTNTDLPKVGDTRNVGGKVYVWDGTTFKLKK